MESYASELHNPQSFNHMYMNPLWIWLVCCYESRQPTNKRHAFDALTWPTSPLHSLATELQTPASYRPLHCYLTLLSLPQPHIEEPYFLGDSQSQFGDSFLVDNISSTAVINMQLEISLSLIDNKKITLLQSKHLGSHSKDYLCVHWNSKYK